MKLEEIGFYTLSDKRAKTASETSKMQRCELIVTDKCNFHCPYCRGLRPDCEGDMPKDRALFVLRQWILDGLQNVRFSGGEPTLYPHLLDLVAYCSYGGVNRIAISTNGSAELSTYKELMERGVNDFSISLDSCCASMGESMMGKCGYFDIVTGNIEYLSKHTYVTVGTVLTNQNIGFVDDIILFAHDLGVADIRIIPAAQETLTVSAFELPIIKNHPILQYRMNRLKTNQPFRGLCDTDCHTCHLLKDDSVVAGNYHFPCVIYLREGGDPIGEVSHNMRHERIEWIKRTDTHKDEICKNNCLDVCVDYNNKAGSP